MPRMQLQRAPHRVLEAVVLHLALDQMRDDLGVGFGLELVSLRLELVLQLEIVLDDAVVHDDDAAGAVAVRVRVLFGRPAVGGPARVADAVEPVDRFVVDGVLEVDELARRAAQLDALRADQRDAGGVVAAVFHAPQPVDQHRDDRLRADVSDDSAHSDPLSLLRPTSSRRSASPCRFLRSTQPSMLRLLRRARWPARPAGTSSVIVEPAPT